VEFIFHGNLLACLSEHFSAKPTPAQRGLDFVSVGNSGLSQTLNGNRCKRYVSIATYPANNAGLLGVQRSHDDYESCPESPENLQWQRRWDQLHLKWPEYGRPRLTIELQREGWGVNEKRVGRLMGVVGLEAIYSKPGTKIYSYLVRGKAVTLKRWAMPQNRTQSQAAKPIPNILNGIGSNHLRRPSNFD